MSENLPVSNGGDLDRKTLLALVTAGDLRGLDDAQRVQYYLWRCEAANLDPKSTPFQYLDLKGKLVLYATKGCTDQLCERRRLTVAITGKEQANGLYIVQARAQDPSGRYTEDVGAVAIQGLSGENLANALMKAVTKAKRRAVLSLVGLGMMDETEAEDLPAQVAPLPPTLPPVDTTTGEVLPAMDRTAEAAKARAGKELHAVARDAGIDPKDRDAIHRVCSMALDREVESVIDLDAADRAITAAWIRANPAAARALAETPEDGDDASEEPRNPTTLLSVQAAETQPSYSVATARGIIQ